MRKTEYELLWTRIPYSLDDAVQYVEFIPRPRALRYQPRSETFRIHDQLLQQLAIIAKTRGCELESLIEQVLRTECAKPEYQDHWN